MHCDTLVNYQEEQERIANTDEVILEVDPDAVESLAWSYDETSLAFHKEDGWLYDEDEAFPVDEEKIAGLLEQFQALGASFIIEDVTDYGEETAVKPKKRFFDSRILIAEFVAVCALCAAILLTNIFMPNSAINTFFENIAGGTTETVKTDDRTYSELTLGRVVSDDIACSVTDGVLTFTGECSVYAPFGGKIANVSQRSARTCG